MFRAQVPFFPYYSKNNMRHLYSILPFPDDLVDLIISFLKIVDLVGSCERNFCHTNKWEFYSLRPKHCFRSMVWHHRFITSTFLGIKLYALSVLKTEFRYVESLRHTDISPTTNGLLTQIFEEDFRLCGHGSCEICMRKLILNEWEEINFTELNFLDRDNHWIDKFIPHAKKLSDNCTRKTWQTLGFGMIQSKLILGVVGHPMFSDLLRLQTLQILLSDRKMCDRILVCYPELTKQLLKYTQQNETLQEIGLQLAETILSLPRVTKKLGSYCQTGLLRLYRGGEESA